MFRSMTQVLNGEIEETDQLSRFHAWPSSPIFKRAFRPRLEPNEADAAILETIEWYKARVDAAQAVGIGKNPVASVTGNAKR